MECHGKRCCHTFLPIIQDYLFRYIPRRERWKRGESYSNSSNDRGRQRRRPIYSFLPTFLDARRLLCLDSFCSHRVPSTIRRSSHSTRYGASIRRPWFGCFASWSHIFFLTKSRYGIPSSGFLAFSSGLAGYTLFHSFASSRGLISFPLWVWTQGMYAIGCPGLVS
ncbi:hypothetical protein BDW02DRAFT_123038 [Decorospora gaudefroyi]|uniref:Uncharacterized protein n=1 Tax=Decorospora gaudefroyi TaxID=184978 RepID=A0A6A5K6F7_9PLEO|nr:hypothetical protein BDW02DRAFT_123038 [Decorospora gaudefroyi]